MTPDTFLLDRVAQPAANRMARWCSPYAVARGLAPGVLVLVVARQWLAGWTWWAAPWIGWGAFLAWVLVDDADTADRATRGFRLNPMRQRAAYRRWMLLAMNALMALPPRLTWIDPVLLLPALAALYLASVERPVPPPQRESAWDRRIAHASALALAALCSAPLGAAAETYDTTVTYVPAPPPAITQMLPAGEWRFDWQSVRDCAAKPQTQPPVVIDPRVSTGGFAVTFAQQRRWEVEFQGARTCQTALAAAREGYAMAKRGETAP